MFHEAAEKADIQPRTLVQVKATLANAKKFGSDEEMAMLMLRHGRLTDDAREYVKAKYL